MKNGQMWKDVDGNDIQAHGGMILEHGGVYYWYGENKNGPTSFTGGCNARTDFVGISCYSSCDLDHWKYEGLALAASDDPVSEIYKTRVGERPKVIYSEKNDEFVMWLHLDTEDYTYAAAGMAVASRPTGPFIYQRSFWPEIKSDCRDMTIFKDQDGTAYLIHSTDWNRTLQISQLTPDYKGFTGVCARACVDQLREAPAVVYRDGLYYMVTSGCTGWDPNSALYAVSRNILSGWHLIDNPCSGPNYRQTFFGQSTYIFEVNNDLYLMLDHWKPQDLKTSGYSILPIHIDGEYMEIPWQDEISFC